MKWKHSEMEKLRQDERLGRGKGGGGGSPLLPAQPPHLSCQLLEQLLQSQLQGNVGDLLCGGSPVMDKRTPPPHTHTVLPTPKAAPHHEGMKVRADHVINLPANYRWEVTGGDGR